jgi:hypothetical protein
MLEAISVPFVPFEIVLPVITVVSPAGRKGTENVAENAI